MSKQPHRKQKVEFRSVKSLPGGAKTNRQTHFVMNVVTGRAEWPFLTAKPPAPAIPRREGAISRHGRLCDTLGKQQRRLTQHKQFVESNRKLHGVVTLSERFPRILPLPTWKWDRRCAQVQAFAAGLLCLERMHAHASCCFKSNTRHPISVVWLF